LGIEHNDIQYRKPRYELVAELLIGAQIGVDEFRAYFEILADFLYGIEKKFRNIAFGIAYYFLDERITCVELRGPAVGMGNGIQFLVDIKIHKFCFIYLLERGEVLYF
jgi:hypothetical protein